jgi:hypothetical protein
MRQSAIIRTARRTVRPVEDRLRSTRLRLHLPRGRARDELRTWLPVEELEAEELEAMNMVGASLSPPNEGRM